MPRSRSATKSGTSSKQVTQYCFRCQAHTVVKDPVVTKLHGMNRKVRQGTCSDCGTNMSTFVAFDTPHDRVQTAAERERSKTKKAETKQKNVETAIAAGKAKRQRLAERRARMEAAAEAENTKVTPRRRRRRNRES